MSYFDRMLVFKRGNPYHDEKGRFTTSDGSVSVVGKIKNRPEEIRYRAGKVQEAFKTIPKQYREGLKVEIVESDPGTFLGRTTPGSPTIQVNYNELHDRIVMGRLDHKPGKRPKYETWQETGNEMFQAEDLGFKEGQEFSKTFISHVLAHEVGHSVWEKLPSEAKMPLLKELAKTDVKSKTLVTYRSWIQDRQDSWRESHGRAPAMLDSRYDREKFAEMFRQYLYQGKHKGFFSKVNRLLAAKSKS